VTFVPRKLDDLTTEYFSECLRSSGVLTDGHVQKVDLRHNADGKGVVAEIVHVRLKYSPTERDAPERIVVKIPSFDDETREQFAGVGMYSNEALFYLHIADQVQLRTPTCYFGHVEEQSGESVIFLEDLSGARPGDRTIPLDPPTAKKIVRELGTFHGEWLNSPKLDTLSSIWDMRSGVMPITNAFPNAWREYRQHDDWKLDSNTLDYGDKLVRRIEEVPESFKPMDVSLRHGDAHHDNMFFVDTPAGVEVIYLDWQIVSLGDPTHDFVTLLSNGMSPRELSDNYRELRDEYRSAIEYSSPMGITDESITTGIRNTLTVQFMRKFVTKRNPVSDSPLSRLLWDRLCHSITIIE